MMLTILRLLERSYIMRIYIPVHGNHRPEATPTNFMCNNTRAHLAPWLGMVNLLAMQAQFQTHACCNANKMPHTWLVSEAHIVGICAYWLMYPGPS